MTTAKTAEDCHVRDVNDLLFKLGWTRCQEDFDRDVNPRPLWVKERGSHRTAKIIVGRRWVTGYLLAVTRGGVPPKIGTMRTVATHDVEAVRALALDVGGQR